MDSYQSYQTVIGCTFSNNVAEALGGAIYNFSYETTVANSILWGDIKDEIA